MGKTPEKTDAVPMSDGERILALDALRGAAVLGILLINIIGVGLQGAYLNPANAGGASGASLWGWIATSFSSKVRCAGCSRCCSARVSCCTQAA